MTMRAVVQRSPAQPDNSWGQPGPPVLVLLEGAVPCYSWSKQRRSVRDDGKEAVIEDLRAMVPGSADIRRGDVLTITDRLNRTLWDGPVEVETVHRVNRSGPSMGHLELMLVRHHDRLGTAEAPVIATANQKTIVKAGHGFVALQWLDKDYALAGAQEATSVVARVINADQFIAQFSGPLEADWSAYSTGPLYLHPTTDGAAQSAQPGPGERFQRLANVQDATLAAIEIQPGSQTE